MSETESTRGLNCPNCGGLVPIPEGQVIVRCLYCDMRSFVRGERGLRRFQVPQRVEREQAIDAMRRFFSSSIAIARGAARESQLDEAFLVYLPFWTVWGRVAAWAFGEVRVGSGDRARYDPREVRLVQEMTWNGAAADVGEFGVTQVPLTDQELDPFDPDALHRLGMVFEPVSSFVEALQSAEAQFKAQVQSRVGLDRISQLFLRLFRHRTGLVYYPLWVLRYLYRGRAFQVAVDGYTGKILYGKAPGNTIYRAGRLVAGMAVGAFLAIDASSAVLYTMGNDDNGTGTLLLVLGLFLGGVALMFTSYRAFRYGEQYEYRLGGKKASILPNLSGLTKSIGEVPGMEGTLANIDVKEIEKWISKLS
jgi:hypothetical protein